jgi:putative CocE/NonD family hydrolase
VPEPQELLQDQVSGRWLERCPSRASGQHWGMSSCGLAAVTDDEGRLQADEGEGVVVLVQDPWRPLPGRGGHLGLDAGPAQRGDLDARCDVACFTTDPCEDPQELLGLPRLTLEATADQPGFDLCVALSRVRSNGEVHQLCTGVARFLGEDCRERRRRQVRLQPLLAVLPAGERLRLSVGLAAWPQIAVNPGDGTMPRGGPGPEHREITVQLHLAGASLCMHPMVGAN